MTVILVLYTCNEQAVVCLSNREIVDASRGRTCHCKIANNRYPLPFFSNYVGLVYLAKPPSIITAFVRPLSTLAVELCYSETKACSFARPTYVAGAHSLAAHIGQRRHDPFSFELNYGVMTLLVYPFPFTYNTHAFCMLQVHIHWRRTSGGGGTTSSLRIKLCSYNCVNRVNPSFEHRGPQCLLTHTRSTSSSIDQFPLRVCSCPL